MCDFKYMFCIIIICKHFGLGIGFELVNIFIVKMNLTNAFFPWLIGYL